MRGDTERRGPGRDPTLLDFGTSQLLSETQATPRKKDRPTRDLEDLDLDLDFGLGPNEQNVGLTPGSGERSVEIGRRATSALRDEPTLLDNDDLGLDFGYAGDDTTLGGPVQPPPDDDMPMLDDGYDIDAANAAAVANAQAMAARRQRDSISPLSDLPAEVELDLNRSFQLDGADDEQDETMVQAAQRVKRRKVMQQDNETQLHNSQIKKQQDDRSAITRQPTFLPRDPLLLQLMEMQRNGSFVSNIMGDSRMAGWAPELRGILSLEVVRSAGEKKRKRDSGIADIEEEPQGLQIPQEDDEGFQAAPGGDFFHSDGVAPPPMSDGIQQPPNADADLDLNNDDPTVDFGAFDTTEAPLLHPSQTGPVSLGTKNAVHLLREHFAPGHASSTNSAFPPTPSKRVKAEALFTDLCPERTTSRPDATKMFFEMLVLGTKDAVKVDQESKELGMPIRVRGKRGLWGDWAERGAGGEIAGSQVGAEAIEI